MIAHLRIAWRVAKLLGALLLCYPLHLAWRLARRRSPWPPYFLGLAARAIGCDWRKEGRPLPAPVLMVANHLSWIDILALGGASGAAFVSKAEVSRWPIVGPLANLNNTLYVERARRGAVREQAEQLRAALFSGQPIALFAEGTTGDGTMLLPFQPSLFAALSPPPPGVLIQPVALDYEDARTIAWPTGEPAGVNALRVLGMKGRRRLTIRFLDPIDPAALPDRKAIATAARAAIADALGHGL